MKYNRAFHHVNKVDQEDSKFVVLGRNFQDFIPIRLKVFSSDFHRPKTGIGKLSSQRAKLDNLHKTAGQMGHHL